MRRFGESIRAGVRRLFVPALRSRRRSDADIEAEIRAHIDARVEHLVARGKPVADARAEAERRFGGVDQALVVLKDSAAQRERVLGAREHLRDVLQDARVVLRGLRRTPAFSIGVVATLTLGLGINSAVFRVADRVLFRAPPGVAAPKSLRRIHAWPPWLASNSPLASALSYREVQALRNERVFAQVATYTPVRAQRLTDGREASATYVDSGYFALLGVKAERGRLFDTRETAPGAEEPVAVISHDFWMRELGGASIADASLTLGTRAYRIVGVAPRSFTGVDLDPIDVWLPLGVAQLGRGVVNGVTIPWWQTDGLRPLRLLARAATGVSDEASAARVATILTTLASSSGNRSWTVQLRPIMASAEASGDVDRRLVGRLAIVAVVVLVIAIANAANLLLARALRRRREIAVRTAIGGSRLRIVRLLLLESATLGAIGGTAAGLVGYWTGAALRRIVFPDARWTTSAFDDRTLIFTLIVALIAGLAAGLAPVAQLTNPDIVTSLKDDRQRTNNGSHLTRTSLVVVQTAFSLALLIASGLLVRSLSALNAVRIGFDVDGLVTTSVPVRGAFAQQLGDWMGERATAVDVAARIGRYPGVHGVALASNVPFGATASMDLKIPGRELPEVPPAVGPYYSIVSANYFSVMGTRLLRGRLFSSSDDRGGAAVTVINQSMAQTLWPDSDPFASCILLRARGICARVIGVVEDVRDNRSLDTPFLRYYLPLEQTGDTAAAVLVRTTPDRAAAVATALRAIIPAQQRPSIEVIADRVARTMRPWETATLLFAAVGVLALLLASIGVYSVMNYIASERVHELGVRVVLGATPKDIATLVTLGGLRLVLVGGVVGLVGAAATSRLLSSLLFRVSPFDPVVYFGAAATLCLVGIVATLMPAIRVMRVDPTVALRVE